MSRTKKEMESNVSDSESTWEDRGENVGMTLNAPFHPSEFCGLALKKRYWGVWETCFGSGELKSRLELVTEQIVFFQKKRWINKERKRKNISLQQIACDWIILHKAGFWWVGGYTLDCMCHHLIASHWCCACVCVCVSEWERERLRNDWM